MGAPTWTVGESVVLETPLGCRLTKVESIARKYFKVAGEWSKFLIEQYPRTPAPDAFNHVVMTEAAFVLARHADDVAQEIYPAVQDLHIWSVTHEKYERFRTKLLGLLGPVPQDLAAVNKETRDRWMQRRR